MYIAVEGVDGTGKTTLVTNLSDRLRAKISPSDNTMVQTVYEPYELFGTIDADYLESLNPWGLACLYHADRLDLLDKRILPALAEGRWVISDRSVYSTLAYQGTGTRGSDPVELDLYFEMSRTSMLAWPALVLYLELPKGHARIEEPAGDYDMDKVADAYLNLITEDPEQFRVIKVSDLTEEEVTNHAWDWLVKRFPELQ